MSNYCHLNLKKEKHDLKIALSLFQTTDYGNITSPG